MERCEYGRGCAPLAHPLARRHHRSVWVWLRLAARRWCSPHTRTLSFATFMQPLPYVFDYPPPPNLQPPPLAVHPWQHKPALRQRRQHLVPYVPAVRLPEPPERLLSAHDEPQRVQPPDAQLCGASVPLAQPASHMLPVDPCSPLSRGRVAQVLSSLFHLAVGAAGDHPSLHPVAQEEPCR